MKKLPSRSALVPSANPHATRGRDLILYVEDNADNWHVAELRLRQRYELLRAVSDRQFCEVLSARGPELSAVLMDIELRGSELNGLELVRLLRRKRLTSTAPEFARHLPQLTLPVIFVTAHGAKYDEALLLAAGGDKVIPKPVDFGALTLVLAHLHLSNAARHRRAP